MLAAAIAWGCSAPSYQKQVSGLSSAMSDVKTSFEALAENERQAFVARRTRMGLRKDTQLVVPEDCIKFTVPANCIPEIRPGPNGRASQKIDISTAVPQGVKLAGRIADYGTSLVTITESKDVSDLKDAVGKANTAVTKLYDDLEGKAASPAFGAVGSFTAWAVGQYLDELRFAQLRDVVRSADGTVALAADVLSREAQKLQKSLLVQKSELLNLESTELARLRQLPADPATIDKAGDTFVADGVALQQTQKADVRTPFKKMREAHAALLASLENPQIPPEVAFAEIGDFIDQVSKLKKALEPVKPSK